MRPQQYDIVVPAGPIRSTPSPSTAAPVLAAVLLAVTAGESLGASRSISLVAGIDLTLSCTQTSPSNPAFFSDGETITLECLITNQGTDPSGQQTTLAAVFSDDEIVNLPDRVLLSNAAVASIPGGAGLSLTLSGSVQYTIPGPLKLCTKVDVLLNNLNNQAGAIQEADEANNVQCSDVEVLAPRRDLIVAPGSVLITPDPRDPNSFRAGLEVQVTYGSRNQGNGAIRAKYTNAIRIGTSGAGALADPNSIICSKTLLDVMNPFQPGGSTVSVTHGFSDPNDPNSLAAVDTCKIPFNLAAGTYALVVQLDSDAVHNILEQTPTGAIAPAEANNALALGIMVGEPFPPQFRIQDDPNTPGDLRVEVFGPGTHEMLVRVASARDLAGYSFRLTWAPPGLLSVGDPNVPGGDINQVEFSHLLETGGRVQDCQVTGIDNTAGHLDVECTTSGPGTGASTETPETLLTITWTAVAPGQGDLTISDMTAESSSGQAFSGLRVLNGITVVSGVGDIAVIDASGPAEAYPGVSFSTSWDVRNRGFGTAFPVSTALVLSRDAIYDDPSTTRPDVVACSFNEPVPIPPLTTVVRDLPSCTLVPNVRPGLYSALFQPLNWDPNNRTAEIVAFPSRFIALRTSGKERVAEISAAPDQLGGTTGGLIARERKYPGKGVASVGSGSRDLNWIVRLVRPGKGKQVLELVSFPKASPTPQDIMTRLRLPKEDRAILGAADVDGDDEDELILLQESKKEGPILDFRRIDFTHRKPEVCQTAAVTGAMAVPIVAATGIQYDLDPADELAVLTADGALNIYDLTLTGSPPPPSPCRPVPTVIHELPATADLTLRAGDASFSSTGDEVLAICALDWQLDGVEEIGSLHEDPSGAQALRIFETPAAPGGMAVLLADDPAFGGTAQRARVQAITCTR